MILEIALLAALGAPPNGEPRTTHLRTTHLRTTHLRTTPPAPPDRWFGTDKVKHFFMSAMIQSGAYSLARSAGASRSSAQIAAGVTSAAFGVAKEVRDVRQASHFCVKDLAWDAAGALAAATLLNGTR